MYVITVNVYTSTVLRSTEIGYASEIEKIKPRQDTIYSYIFFSSHSTKVSNQKKQVLDEIDYNSEQNVRANGAVSVVDGWRK